MATGRGRGHRQEKGRGKGRGRDGGKACSAGSSDGSSTRTSSSGGDLQEIKLQQIILDVFRHAFGHILTEPLLSSSLPQTLQEIKGHLYKRDFVSAFSSPEYLTAYAARWSASRALGYLDIFQKHLEPHLAAPLTATALHHQKEEKGKVREGNDGDNGLYEDEVPQLQRSRGNSGGRRRHVCLGAGAGAELVGLCALASRSSYSRIETILIDIAAWQGPVLSKLLKSLTTPKPLSPYASATARTDASEPLLLDPARLSLTFHQHDLLSPNEAERGCIASSLRLPHHDASNPHNNTTTAHQSSVVSLAEADRAKDRAVGTRSRSKDDDDEEEEEEGEKKEETAQSYGEQSCDDGDAEDKRSGSDVVIITLLFTLNELYSTSLGRTQALLLDITTAAPPGALLLVVDSPGSYSTVSVNGSEKKYPMKWLLDHTLLSLAASISPFSGSSSTSSAPTSPHSYHKTSEGGGSGIAGGDTDAAATAAAAAAAAAGGNRGDSRGETDPINTDIQPASVEAAQINETVEQQYQKRRERNKNKKGEWEKLEEHDSAWFRLPSASASVTSSKYVTGTGTSTSTSTSNSINTQSTRKKVGGVSLEYPLDLENMRYQLHLYRRV